MSTLAMFRPFLDDFSYNPFLDQTRTVEETFVDGSDTVVEIEVPGASSENVEVAIHERLLKIAWKRHTRAGEQKGSRTYCLGKNSDESAITASVKDGLLSVRIPKKPEAMARKIPVLTT